MGASMIKELLLVLGAAVLATATMAAVETGTGCKLGGIDVPGFEVKAISPTQFQTLHTAVAPRGESERWMEIPWQTDLQAARKLAAQEKKPLLMWVMDGHPLGCT